VPPPPAPAPIDWTPPAFRLAGGNQLQLIPVPPGPQAGTGNSGATTIPANPSPIQPTAPQQNEMQAPGGQLTLGQANQLFRDGGVGRVIVDPSKYDFSGVNPDGFKPDGTQNYTFPYFKDGLPSEGGLVDGTVVLQKNPDGKTFSVQPDTYDFDMKDWSQKPFRNIATLGAHFFANGFVGPQHPFDVIFPGKIPLQQKKPQ
jgi:hypothetical protein